MYFKIIAKGSSVCLAIDDEMVYCAPVVNVYNNIDPVKATQLVRLNLCNNLDMTSIDTSDSNLFTLKQEKEVSILLKYNWNKIRYTYNKMCKYNHIETLKRFKPKKHIPKNLRDFSKRRYSDEDGILWETFPKVVKGLNCRFVLINTIKQVHTAVVKDTKIYKFYLSKSLSEYPYIYPNKWCITDNEKDLIEDYIKTNEKELLVYYNNAIKLFDFNNKCVERTRIF